MRRKLNYDIIKKEFNDRGYKLLSKTYKKNTQKLEYICPKHKDKGVLTITFQNFTAGSGCSYCSKRIKRTQSEYVEDLKNINPNIKVIGEYVNLKTKIVHKCLKCGYEWDIRPDNLLHGKQGCPRCSHRARLTHDEIVAELNNTNPYVEMIDEYQGDTVKINFKCKHCGHIWKAKPNNIRNGKGCPVCKSSKGEKEIVRILQLYNIDYKKEYWFKECKYIHVLPFDFYLPKYNICIEYDGLQHFEPCTFGGVSQNEAQKAFELTKIKDNIKTEYCKNNNIKLIRISYKDYKDIENIILSHLN